MRRAFVIRINANTYTTRCVCRDTQFAGAVVYRINAMHAAGRGGRVNRQVSARGLCYTPLMPSVPLPPRCRTRCCDAQCAFAVVYRINAISSARRGGRFNRERRACGRVISHKCHLPEYLLLYLML